MKWFFWEKFVPKFFLFFWLSILVFQITWLFFNFFSASNLQITNSVISCFGCVYLTRFYLNQYKPTKKWQLRGLVDKQIKRYGYGCDLNHINVSKITDMEGLFFQSEFNGNISKWDVSNVKSMDSMFNGAFFNGDISKWDVSNVTNMNFMFMASKFNGDISGWDVSNVTKMNFMFYESECTGDLTEWEVINLDSMDHMFSQSKFEDISLKKLGIMDDKNLLPAPYWAEHEDPISRKNAVMKRSINKELISDLKVNDIKAKRTKI
jgi:surface protein